MLEVDIKWRPRKEPVVPIGFYLSMAQGKLLLRQLKQMPKDQLSSLKGCFTDDVIVVLGETARLPWIPDAKYVGKSAIAPQLLMPTQLQPTLSEDLLCEAVIRKFGSKQLLVCPWKHRVYDVSSVLSISIEKLEALIA